MPADDRSCVFNPTTNSVVDFLRPGESEVEALLRLAQDEPHLVVLPLDEARQRHEVGGHRGGCYIGLTPCLPHHGPGFFGRNRSTIAKRAARRRP